MTCLWKCVTPIIVVVALAAVAGGAEQPKKGAAPISPSAKSDRTQNPREANMSIKKEMFGKLPDGAEVELYMLTNKSDMRAAITNYGGIVVSLWVPDRQGQLADVVLGFDTLDEYRRCRSYFGVLIGRYGNRIAQGKFTLHGKEYTLAQNDHGQHLHGGIRGFDKVLWKVVATSDGEEPSVTLQYLSKDGEEGYPGNLLVTVTYTLTDANGLKIDYLAKTDQTTVVNLTNHSYVNLAGAGSGDILGHQLTINADRFTPVATGLIPTGELRPVAGTPFDFRQPNPIGARIDGNDEQLKLGRGYDHNWVLNKKNGKDLTLAAQVVDPTSGRVMEVLSTEPGIQFYSGNFLDGRETGKGGKSYKHRYAFCLELQHFPDSPNRPEFPSTVLHPGEEYHATTIYQFSTK
jgi:aldose 1-epimerase